MDSRCPSAPPTIALCSAWAASNGLCIGRAPNECRNVITACAEKLFGNSGCGSCISIDLTLIVILGGSIDFALGCQIRGKTVELGEVPSSLHASSPLCSSRTVLCVFLPCIPCIVQFNSVIHSISYSYWNWNWNSFFTSIPCWLTPQTTWLSYARVPCAFVFHCPQKALFWGGTSYGGSSICGFRIYGKFSDTMLSSILVSRE